MTSACGHHMKSRELTLIKEWLVISINSKMVADRSNNEVSTQLVPSLCMDEVTGTATSLCIKIHLAFFTELKQ